MKPSNPAVENLRQFLNTGATFCNIGQINRKVCAWLNRQVRAQRIIRYQDHNRFPQPKFCYYVPFGCAV